MRRLIAPRVVSLTLLVFLAAAGLARVTAQEEQPITREMVISVLQNAFPELKLEDINVRLLKRLTSRVKVNLDIEGRNAILYLTWQRRGGAYQWWFEYDEKRSLVYLSKTTRSARRSAVGETPAEPQESKTAEEQSRTEILELGQEAAEETPEEASEVEPQAEAVPERVEAEAPEAEREAPAEPEESAPAESRIFGELPPLEVAIGGGATSKQFLSALVSVLARGEVQHYPEFLLRPEEVAEGVRTERFKNLEGIWREQCESIHAVLQKAGRIELSKVMLHRARSEEVEKATIERIRKTVPTVREIFTRVRMELILDSETVYLEIGGLMRIDSGWRVGGRMQFVNPAEK